MKILLFGKTGQLGWELNRTLASLGELYALGRDQLDIGDLKMLDRVIREIKPDILVNASAYAAVDRAEEQPELAFRLNAHAPALMGEIAREIGAVLVHYSTDYVFDGTKNSAYDENDPTNPLNVYGQSKLKGEQAVVQAGGAYVILRTSWVYSLRGDGFVSKVLAWARNQETLKIVADQMGSPTWARMLAETTAAMIAQSFAGPKEFFTQKSGVYHLGGSGGVSRFDFGRAILQADPRAGEQIARSIQPAHTADFPTPALRPLHTVLDCSRFENIFGLRLPAWEAALQLAMDMESRSV